MPQQINLFDPSLCRQREWLGSAGGVCMLAAALCVSVALAFGLRVKSSQALVLATAAEAKLDGLRSQVTAAPSARLPSISATELARLRAVESGQARVRAALDSGKVGATQGHSPYLLALSRQMQGKLWLTEFSVASDGRSLELGGRMTNPRELPDYLRRLNAEPLFRGREFAQLSLKAMVSDNAADGAKNVENIGPDYAEFVLRSAANASAQR